MTFIWATALVIGVLVFVHELGHFLAARSVGVRVEKFSIGFPPRFISVTSVDDGFDIKIFFYRIIDGHFKWTSVINFRIGIPGRVGSSTEYTIALIPLGGYVKMAGVIDESLDTVITNSPDEFMSKSVIQKIWILSAGVLMNILIAFILFSGISYVQGKPEVIDNRAIIGEVVSGNSADKAGLKPGDEIISINNQNINKWIDLQTVLRPIPNTLIDVNIIRDDKELNFSFNTSSNFIPNQNGIDTIGVIGIAPVTIYQPITLAESFSFGLNGTLNSFGMIMLTFKMLGNGSASISDLGGPIMIGKIAGEAAETGWMPLFTLMALISVNLAFLNILPIPGLDGGQIFIILIETIIRKPLSLKARLAVQQLGMVFLLMIMVTVMFNDISRLFN